MIRRWHLLLLGCFVLATWPGILLAEVKKDAARELVIDSELVNADLKDTTLTESFSKTFTFKMVQGKTYVLEMTSPSFTPHIRLEHPNGQAVAADQSGGGGGKRSSRIFYHAPKPGEYQIVATTPNAGAMGKFTLSIKELPPPDGKPIELKLENGLGTYVGMLLQNDLRYRNKLHKLVAFPMEAGKTYQIDMISGAFDVYLFLEDPDNKLVAQDDDSGGNLNARIIFRATKTGKHRIICTHFAPTATGPFTLAVREVGKAK